MDALCIDQDATQEKSHQVGMMGQIYGRSKHVFACVGPHTDDSLSLFRTMDENKALLTRIDQSILKLTTRKESYWVMPNPILKSERWLISMIRDFSTHRREALATVFIAFMNRPYFSRVWILQELYLARHATLCCGMDRYSFADLLTVSILIDFWISNPHQEDYVNNEDSEITDKCSLLPWFSRRRNSCLTLQESFHKIGPQRGCLTFASGVRGRRRLAEVLDAMQSFQCADVRDRLFGVQALIEWGSGEPPVPDYSKDNYQVAIEVLQLYLQNIGTEPVSGVAVEWPRRLWNLFQVNIEDQAIQLAITKRFGSRIMPNNSSSVDNTELDPKPIGYSSPSLSLHMIHLPGSALDHERTTWYRDCIIHPRDMWRGVQLLDSTSIAKEFPTPGGISLHYLYCSAQTTIRGSNSEIVCVEILDHMQRVLAYAPAETRPSDWLLFSEEGFLSDGSPMMVVVRSESDGRREHAMIGQAFRNCHYQETALHLLQWRYFGVHWHAEDLFLFGCMNKEIPVHSMTSYYSKRLVA